jgi:hypothetical protein
MSDTIRHIVAANDLGLLAEKDCVLFRTCAWQLVPAPDDPSVLAIFAATTAGPQIGLEFPVSEARELARQLMALTTKTRDGAH